MIDSIALNMVVYNEEHRIVETLELAEPYVDEIVIVNQASTDGTLDAIDTWDVACNHRRVPLKIINDVHWGYCEPSRHRAWAETESEWILVLDADERISDEFAAEMRGVDSHTRNVRLKRSFWLAGEHRFTGDYQHRFFHRTCVEFLNEIHTEPQPKGWYPYNIYSPEYVGIWHEKSWSEQIRDELAYEEILKTTGETHKLSLNVHLPLVNESGLTPEEIDKLTIEERRELGLSA